MAEGTPVEDDPCETFRFRDGPRSPCEFTFHLKPWGLNLFIDVQAIPSSNSMT